MGCRRGQEASYLDPDPVGPDLGFDAPGRRATVQGFTVGRCGRVMTRALPFHPKLCLCLKVVLDRI